MDSMARTDGDFKYCFKGEIMCFVLQHNAGVKHFTSALLVISRQSFLGCEDRKRQVDAHILHAVHKVGDIPYRWEIAFDLSILDA